MCVSNLICTENSPCAPYYYKAQTKRLLIRLCQDYTTSKRILLISLPLLITNFLLTNKFRYYQSCVKTRHSSRLSRSPTAARACTEESLNCRKNQFIPANLNAKYRINLRKFFSCVNGKSSWRLN